MADSKPILGLAGGIGSGKSTVARLMAGDTPTVTISSACWALDHLLHNGGSGYLPMRIAGGAIASGKLHPVPAAPEFTRAIYLVVNTDAAARWPWFDSLRQLLQSE